MHTSRLGSPSWMRWEWRQKPIQICRKTGLLTSAAHGTTCLTLTLALYRIVYCKDIDLPDSLPHRKNFKKLKVTVYIHQCPFDEVKRAGSSHQAGGDSAQRRGWAGPGVQWDPRQLPQCHGPTQQPPLAYRNACVHFRREAGFWRRIKTFSLQWILTTNLCMKSQYQIPQAQPRIVQNQALAGSMILGPFNRISRTQAGGRGGSIPAIPELQVLGNWEFSREEKGTI